VFGEWIGRNPDRPVFVEVSAALLEEESEGVPATTEAEGLALGEALRAVGLARVVFGSDYPVFSPQRYAAALAARTGLSPEELRLILDNSGPLLRGAAAP
jgi:predicted TIM-barrel fold metal-dependent hydrolase